MSFDKSPLPLHLLAIFKLELVCNTKAPTGRGEACRSCRGCRPSWSRSGVQAGSRSGSDGCLSKSKTFTSYCSDGPTVFLYVVVSPLWGASLGYNAVRNLQILTGLLSLVLRRGESFRYSAVHNLQILTGFCL